ncbi:MAG: tRNA lysidine(34) synthetase TilS [Clostridiales bacterium GWB2_37_7]|nr:MAG: tRNA lysidine(34) synthetase TilS [Clostridiales bacterium GWB2_37_7]
MNSFVDNVKSTIEKHNMIKNGDTVVVGVSGGADSLCLLHVLKSLSNVLDIRLFAVHLNHMFRGLDAKNDADFVEQICLEWNIPFKIETFDVPAYAKQQGLSPEEAGREIRYKLFREAKEQMKANKIAVAQNSNDNVETILMRLIRGTGLEGLKGIDAVRDDIIRPLLDSDRQSIEKYCRENDLDPRVDKTNLEPIYLRNKIRLELLPYLKENFNPNLNEALTRMAQVVREENEYLERQTEEYLESMGRVQENCITIETEKLKQLHPAMQKRLLRKGIEKLATSLNGFEYKHFQGMIEMLDKSTGAAIELPKSLKAYISYENLIICKKIEKPDKKCYYKLKYNYDNLIGELASNISIKLIDSSEMLTIPKSCSTVYLDADKIKNELILRSRETGDVISPIGMKGSKKLKDYFIDKKVPKEKRDQVLLLTDGNEIIWIPGSIISEKYKVTSNTQKVIVLSCNNCGFLQNNINSTKEDVACKMI